jgi:hypothetical protein
MAKSKSLTGALRRLAEAVSGVGTPSTPAKPGKKKRLTEAIDEIAEELKKKHP